MGKRLGGARLEFAVRPCTSSRQPRRMDVGGSGVAAVRPSNSAVTRSNPGRVPWAAEGLSWTRLSEATPRIGVWWLNADLPLSTASYAVVVRRDAENGDFERAWDAGDHERIGELLSYPPCCRLFFHEVSVAQRCIDTVWAMSESESRMDERASGRLVDGPVASNIFLQSIGVRAVPHCPCSFGCRETLRLAEELKSVAAAVGYEQEYTWLESIMSWPTEWSALHGIAETRTPVLKLCTPTDATASEYVVRWKGTALPGEAARGLGFPYRVPGRSPALVRLDPLGSRG